MAVTDVAVGIEVARLEHHAPIDVRHGHVKPDKPFGIESGRHVVAVGPVLELHLEGNAGLIRPIDEDIAKAIADPQQLKPLATDFGEQIQVVAEDVERVVAVLGLRPAGRELVIVGYRLLERVRAPACLMVERQSLARCSELLSLGVVGKDARVDDRIVLA